MLQKKNSGMNMMHDNGNSGKVVRKYLNPCSGLLRTKVSMLLRTKVSMLLRTKVSMPGDCFAFFMQRVTFHSFCQIEVTHFLYGTVLHCVMVTIHKTWLYDFKLHLYYGPSLFFLMILYTHII